MLHTPLLHFSATAVLHHSTFPRLLNQSRPMSPQPHILMCPPDYYGIHYEINPWMDMTLQAEHAVAVGQWQALYNHIQDADAQVSLLDPVEGLPDLVFTANAAM